MRVPAALLLGAVLIASGGCGGDEPEVTERNEPAVAELKRQLAGTGDYSRLEVSYADDATSREILFVSVVCESCDAVATADRAVELAWGSEVEPLRTINVHVDDTATDTLESRTLVLTRDGAELAERYGERPVESGAGARTG